MAKNLALGVAVATTIWPVCGHAQAVNQYDYKQYAVCVERVINGKIFNTFGEGQCPSGHRRTLPSQPYDSLDPNDKKLAQTQTAVSALAGMQQSVLAWGNARIQRRREETIRLLSEYAMEIPVVAVGPEIVKYTKVDRRLPDVGMQSFAEVGQPLIFAQSGFYSDCILSQDDHEKSSLGWVHMIKAGEPACKISESDKSFTPSYINYSRDDDRASDPMIYEQAVEMEKQSYSICIKDMGMKFLCLKNLPEGSVRRFTGFVGSKGTNQALVSYQGTIDGILQFAYNPPSGAPTSLIAVNPAEGRLVTIGEINFEIVEWNDSAIAVKMR